jgi:PEP-CTERM motif
MHKLLIPTALAVASTLASASVLVTRDAAAIEAFQQGLTVLDFEGAAPLGRTPQAITNYQLDTAVNPAAFLFDQAPGVQFSVGGMVGVNMPAIHQLSGALVGQDAASGSNVLGTVDFEFTTNFAQGAFMEIYFPTKVSRVGFWVNQQLDFVSLIALNTNFAFSGLDEETLETGIGSPGFFVGIERAGPDIGGFKILGRGAEGFTIDDFSYGGAAVAPIPEPGTLALLLAGFGALWARHRWVR